MYTRFKFMGPFYDGTLFPSIIWDFLMYRAFYMEPFYVVTIIKDFTPCSTHLHKKTHNKETLL